ncbi:unnamed protein product, partial [Ectocarpus sp. 12 AP-2014]
HLLLASKGTGGDDGGGGGSVAVVADAGDGAVAPDGGGGGNSSNSTPVAEGGFPTEGAGMSSVSAAGWGGEEVDAAVVVLDTRAGMEMLSDHVLACFVEEFNRLLSDAIFEALVADQGLGAPERRRRGSRRAFEPPPPLFLPAPQLLDGIVQICHGAAELLHTHFCCTQWHFSAFDDRLEDDAFLHTADTLVANSISDSSSSNNSGSGRGGGDGVLGQDRPSSSSPTVEGRDGGAARASDPRIEALRRGLVRQRGALWE